MEAGPEQKNTARSGPISNPRGFLERYGSLLALAAVLLVGCIFEKDFRKAENIVNVLRQNSVVGIIAVGMTFVIIMGGIDLSVGSMMALLGGLGITAMNAGAKPGASPWGPILLCVGVAVVGGLFLGLCNGVLIAKGRIAPFVATLAALAAFRSICQLLAQGGAYSASVPEIQVLNDRGLVIPFVYIAEKTPLTIFYPLIAFFGVAALAEALMRTTPYGTHVRAIGDNTLAARYAAVRIDRVRIVTYGLLGLLCGVAAVFFAARLATVTSSTDGVFLEVDAIAAVVVGGTSMRGGAGRIWGTVVGVLILGFVDNLMSIGVTPWIQHAAANPGNAWLRRQDWLKNIDANLLTGLIKAVIIIGAVLLQRGREAR